MAYNSSIFNGIENDFQRIQLLEEMRNELFEIRCESSIYVDNSERLLRLKKRFHFFGNEALIQAEFYHHCRSRNIPCLIEVRYKFMLSHVIFDCVIEINGKDLVIEFKNCSKSELDKFKDQLIKYKKSNIAILLIYNDRDFSDILDQIEKYEFDNKIYEYCFSSRKIIEHKFL